ncbi:MAG: alanine racemase [Bradymonadaceae bacterium]
MHDRSGVDSMGLGLTTREVAEMAGGELAAGEGSTPVEAVATDTRQPIPDRALFVALRGPNFDGHAFLDEAIEAGATAILVASGQTPGGVDIASIEVEDPLDGLQSLAAAWRAQFELPVVGVTGSNGKTIVKDMLAGIFARERTVHASPASYNSQVGVALTLLGLRPEHDIAVVEAGISQTGEMEHLEAMIEPTAGVVTNIGSAHAAGLPTLAITAREKMKLFDGLEAGPLVYPAGCEPIEELAPLPGEPVSTASPSGGAVESADYAVDAVDSLDPGFAFELQMPNGERRELAIHVPGRHNLDNAVTAAATAAELGADVASIRDGLASYEASPMRLEIHTTPADITLINDAYSSDPTSARAALSALERYGAEGRSVAILGDMLDLGERSEEAHRQLGRAAADLDVDLLICVGERARWIGRAAGRRGLPDERIRQLPSVEALHGRLGDLLASGDTVLFKASRRIELDRAAQQLLESLGPSRLTVDLGALRDNYHALHRHIGADVDFMAVVKSFGYGNDSTRVSQTLIREGADALAVAYPDEAIPLRERGLQVPILVTNVLPHEVDKIVEYELTAQLYSEPVLEALSEEAARREECASVHLMIDTGMNRVGLDPDEAPAFARRVDEHARLDLTGTMTHFAAADLPEEDDFTRDQLARFDAVLEAMRSADIDPGVVHAANTAAAWRFPNSHYDMVRVGLGLYGLSPSGAVEAAAVETRPALTFSTQIVDIHQVDPGETVGYGRNWRADRPTTIATVAAGYNDGLPRFMSNGGEVLIGGRCCPIVGDVCMDVAMVDVTAVPGVEVGDEVVIFGSQGDEEVTIDAIAQRGGTINYEILCNISPRVRRVFVRGSD